MHTHTETTYSPYSPAQLYAMVMDVAKYPEFLPWCKAARVVSTHADYFTAELVIGYQNITESYVSRVQGSGIRDQGPGNSNPIPNPQSPIPTILVTHIRGPFKHLTNEWKFVPAAQGGTDIHFSLSFQFQSKLLNSLIGNFFEKAVEKMTSAFLARADALYKT